MLDIFTSFNVNAVEVQRCISPTSVIKRCNDSRNSKLVRITQRLRRVCNLGQHRGTPREVTKMSQSLLLGFAEAEESQSFRYLNYFNNLSYKVMKYLLATCGADQQRSKKNTDLGNFIKYVVLQPERLE